MLSAFQRLLAVLNSCLFGLLKRLVSAKLMKILIRFRALEKTAFAIIIGGTLWVYVYGMVYVLPFVSGESTLFHIFGFLLGTWCLFGVLSNLFLIRCRDSSIRHKFLNHDQPVVSSLSSIDSAGSDTAWHFCDVCDVYVPPRAWHCTTCKTCILRRDHHCVFAMSCIGEDNHIHFLGFLAYFAFGATCATLGGMYYMFYNFGISPLMYTLRCLFSTYIVFFDFSFASLLASLTLMAGGAAGAFYLHYFILACRNITAADRFRGIERPVTEGKQYSYANLKKFLGPNPVMRIIWPLSSVLKHDYNDKSHKIERQ